MTELSFNIRFMKFRPEPVQVTFQEGLHIIYGESGSGKTAFLVRIAGKGPQLQRENFTITDLHYPGEAYVICQNPDHQIIGRTLQGELAFTAECAGLDPEKIEKIVTDGLDMLPYRFDPARNPAFLSGGEKELLNLVTAMQVRAQVILIDDGLSFLSVQNKEAFTARLKHWALAEKKIIVWVTSDWSDLEYSDSRWRLDLASLGTVTDREIQDYQPVTVPPGQLSLLARDLAFEYDDREIFRSFNIHVSGCRSLGLLGDNGMGKTTLAGLCSGHLKPSSGQLQVTIDGMADILTGYVDQFPERLIQFKTPAELAETMIKNDIFDPGLSATFHNRLARFQIVWDRVADQRGIDLPWVTLRTLIVVLMAHCRYELLILDEPTFGLGRKQKVILRSFLKECMVTKHLFVASHDRNFVQSICDQIIDIDQNTYVHNKKINLERPQS